MEEIRWGMIGCGSVTEKKSGPAFNKVDNSRLIAVMRRNGGLARDYAQRHKVPFWYDNAEELINNPEINAVYIATPPETHAEYAIRAMRAGKPVYVEKPMARTAGECQRMLDISRATGVPLYVAYYRRRLPGFRKVKELLSEGAIGTPQMVNIRFTRPIYDEIPLDRDLPWRVIPSISGGGLFFDLASHQLDAMDFIFGPIKEAKGLATNKGNRYPAEDMVSGNWIHENGTMGSGFWCFSASKSERRDELEIIGSKGKINFSTFEFSPITVQNQSGTSEYPLEEPEHVQQNLIESIVQDLRNEGTCPSTGVSAARTNRILDQMVENYYPGG